MLPTWYESVVESQVFNALFFVLPMLIANVTPMMFGGGVPMDFRKNFFDGRRILGNSKTIRGFIAGCLGGFLMGIFTWWWFNNIIEVPFEVTLANGFFQGFGAVTGDIVGSFIKRRRNIQSGGSLLIVDQTGFMVFGLLFGMIGLRGGLYPWTYWIITIPIAAVVHFSANAVGYTLGWKEVWW